MALDLSFFHWLADPDQLLAGCETPASPITSSGLRHPHGQSWAASPHQRGYEGQRARHMASPGTQKSPRILAEAECAGFT